MIAGAGSSSAAGTRDIQGRTAGAGNLPTAHEIGADVAITTAIAPHPRHRYRAIEGGDQRIGATHKNTKVTTRPIDDVRPIAAGAIDGQGRTAGAGNLPTAHEIGAIVVSATAIAPTNPLHRHRARGGGDPRIGAIHNNTIVTIRPIAAGAQNLQRRTAGAGNLPTAQEIGADVAVRRAIAAPPRHRHRARGGGDQRVRVGAIHINTIVTRRPIAGGAIDGQRRTAGAGNLPTGVETGAVVATATTIAPHPRHCHRARGGGDQRVGATHKNTKVIIHPIAASAIDIQRTAGGLYGGVGVDDHTVVIGCRGTSIPPLTEQGQASCPCVIGTDTAAGTQINSRPVCRRQPLGGVQQGDAGVIVIGLAIGGVDRLLAGQVATAHRQVATIGSDRHIAKRNRPTARIVRIAVQLDVQLARRRADGARAAVQNRPGGAQN